jgi:hypothetical protein
VPPTSSTARRLNDRLNDMSAPIRAGPASATSPSTMLHSSQLRHSRAEGPLTVQRGGASSSSVALLRVLWTAGRSFRHEPLGGAALPSGDVCECSSRCRNLRPLQGQRRPSDLSPAPQTQSTRAVGLLCLTLVVGCFFATGQARAHDWYKELKIKSGSSCCSGDEEHGDCRPPQAHLDDGQ